MSRVFGGRIRADYRLERTLASSPHYEDGAFRNTRPVGPGLKKGAKLPTLGEFFWGGQRRTPTAPLPSVSPLDAWTHAPETGLRATWLGHSTVLVEIDGVRLLTDPVWGERVSPVTFAGPKRFQPVPVPVSALPPLDVVIISHDHYDHLDYPTILELARRDVPFITSLGVGAHLEAWGVARERITELDWWESVEVRRGGVRVTATASQHFSGRGLGSRNKTSSGRRSPSGVTSIRSSSAATRASRAECHAEIARRAGPFDLVMLEVGAFHPAWGDIHLGPENALEALALLGGGSFLPVHWGTFNLAIHAWDDPAETLLKLAPARGAHLVMPRLGEAVEPSRVETVEPWWRGTIAETDGQHRGERDSQRTPAFL